MRCRRLSDRVHAVRACGSYTCRPGFQCRCSGSGEANAWCSYQDNPNYGATSFDSFLWAMVTLFTVTTDPENAAAHEWLSADEYTEYCQRIGQANIFNPFRADR